jgi:hypothetical protein
MPGTHDTYICPHKKVLKLKVRCHHLRNVVYRHYQSRKEDCRDGPFQERCLAKSTTKIRHLLIPLDKSEEKKEMVVYKSRNG